MRTAPKALGDRAPAASATAWFFLIPRDTKAQHDVQRLEFDYVNSNQYDLETWTPANFSTQMIPGVYDLVYRRGDYQDYITQTEDADPYINGHTVLQRCVEVP